MRMIEDTHKEPTCTAKIMVTAKTTTHLDVKVSSG